MTPMRFCFLTTFYPPYHFGGDAIGTQRLAQALGRRGHAVTVVHDSDAYRVLAPRMPAAAPPDPLVRVVTLRSALPVVSTLLTQQLGRPVVNGARIRQLLNDGAFDVIVFNNISLVGGPDLLGYGSGIKIYLAHEHWLVCPTHVLWRHGRERCDQRECVECQLRHRRPPQLWRHTGLLERQLAHVDAFVAMSEFSRGKHRDFGFPRDMEVIPYFFPDDAVAAAPVDTASPHPRPYFLFVGRLEAIKGLDDVVPLFKRYPDADLLIAGDGTHAGPLRALAGNAANIRFLGHTSAADLARYYRHALALIVPSICYETFGIILIEAFRYGTPVIDRRMGPFPEIVNQPGAGELFDTGDELLAALHGMQHDPERRARLGRAALSAVETVWSERVVVPRFLDLVGRLAARKGRRDPLPTLTPPQAAPSLAETRTS